MPKIFVEHLLCANHNAPYLIYTEKWQYDSWSHPTGRYLQVSHYKRQCVLWACMPKDISSTSLSLGLKPYHMQSIELQGLQKTHMLSQEEN